MAVKIRLKQTGKRNARTFRIVVVDESKKRDGRVLEEIGWINPLTKPFSISIKNDRLNHWKSLGAQISESLIKFIQKP